MLMNKIVGRYGILLYPNSSENFIVHADAIKIHLRRVIRKNGNTIDSLSIKFTPAKIDYTITEI